VTLTLSASTAATLLVSPRGSVRRVSGFVLVGDSDLGKFLISSSGMAVIHPQLAFVGSPVVISYFAQ